GPWEERPRQRGAGLRTVGRILLVALLVAVVGAILLGVRAATFNATVTDTPLVSTALLGPLNGSDRVNVMTVGYGGADHDGAYLADSIQILSIDPATDTTTTVPIPRDLWIEGIDRFSQNGKVNEVYAVGHGAVDGDEADRLDNAGELLAEVLSEVTGLEIHHWLAIDFAGFQEMVDAVGGVTVQNPVAFNWTTIEEFHRQGRWEMGGFESGEIHLDGEEALTYARARYTSVVAESNDFARSIRQARILGALRSKLGAGGIGSIPSSFGLMDAMERRVRTDLSAIDLFLLSSHLSSDRRVVLAEDVALTATTNTIGQYILVPFGWTGPGDYAGLRAYLANELASSTETGAADATDAP
ncbi:MAG TPA: LCP family protein, partial [Candidatus Limnocylindria bacterium]